MINICVPDDTSSLSLFADEIAELISKEALDRKIGINLIRKGSYGIFSYEPLIEIENKNGRFFIGPVKENDVAGLFDNNVFSENFNGGFNLKNFNGNEIFSGKIDDFRELVKQKRLIFSRAGTNRSLSLEDYINSGGLSALRKIIGIETERGKGGAGVLIIGEIKKSGLRGKGGAGFPVWIKWDAVLKENSETKYIVCNADEGDSGAFADRIILEGSPFGVIEGMIIAGIAVGAKNGYIYLRSEYVNAKKKIFKAIGICRDAGLLGNSVLNSGISFDIDLIVGGGSYVCGEETALLESMENRRGAVRVRPPVPAVSGLYNKPTVLNNVLTFAYVSYILSPPTADAGGLSNSDYFSGIGTEDSKGTMAFQVSGAVKHPGIYEMPLGITLKELLELPCGLEGGRRLKAVQIGGPLGAYFPVNEEFLGLELSYEGLAQKGGILGHGGVVVFGESADMKHMLLRTLEFCIDESCGKCSPCRLGSTRIKELTERVLKKQNIDTNLEIINEILGAMEGLSLCGLGAMLHYPVNSLLKYFKQEIMPA
ncbi:MAG: NADH-ubiquinone oxidoreductase-F iron-sulfur binding region domain-containing protein [bacterium]